MQPSFFDQENRLAQLEKLGDPLPRLDSIVDWDEFKPILKVIYQKKRKSNAGRKPWDTVLMFKMLVLQSRNYSPLRLSTSLPRWIYNRFFMSVEA